MSDTQHNEVVCHAAGERRQNYLNQIKLILDKMDTTPCVRDVGGTAGQDPSAKPLIEYPGYINRLNPKFNKPFYVPLITNVPIKETRFTCDVEAMKDENSKNIQYVQVDGYRAPPMMQRNLAKGTELHAGYAIHGCDCVKHNGLQDKCPRMECGGRPACLTEPVPSCEPAKMYLAVGGAPNMKQIVDEALERSKKPKLQYCCCDKDDKTEKPAGFTCQPCSH